MLKLLTLNLLHDRERWEKRFPLVVETIHAEQPDIITLQEVHIPRGQADYIAEHLNARIPSQPYSVYVAPKWGDPKDTHEGIGILSRLPVLEYERRELPMVWRVAQRIRVPFGDGHLNIANTHLHHEPIGDEKIRLPQMEALLAWMDGIEAGGWLLAGDMNALPDSATIRKATERLQSAYPTVHGENVPTYPTPLIPLYQSGLRLTIDYILFDGGRLRVKEARRIADKPHPHDDSLYPSDHYGLVAVFEAKES